MPIDTAVAAIASEIASAIVANSSTPARRRFAFALSAIGEVKPTCPFSAVIGVILAASSPGLPSGWANQSISLAARFAAKYRRGIGRTLANSLKKKGKFVILVNEELTADRVTAISCRCDFAATLRHAYASAAAVAGRNSIGTNSG
jgi:hypothetical protein